MAIIYNRVSATAPSDTESEVWESQMNHDNDMGNECSDSESVLSIA
jgi:hypothetical protein